MFVFHQGVLWMIIATIFFALMGTFVKLGGESFTPTELVFYRSSISLFFIIAIMRWNDVSYSSNYMKLHLTRSSIGFISLLFFFYAINHLPLSTAISLNYTSPIFLGLLMPLILKRRIKKWLFLAVAIGFVGVFFILKPTFENQNYFAGLIGLISGLGAAMAYLFVTQLGQLKEPVLRTIFYFTLISTICSGSIMFFGEIHIIQFEHESSANLKYFKDPIYFLSESLNNRAFQQFLINVQNTDDFENIKAESLWKSFSNDLRETLGKDLDFDGSLLTRAVSLSQLALTDEDIDITLKDTPQTTEAEDKKADIEKPTQQTSKDEDKKAEKTSDDSTTIGSEIKSLEDKITEIENQDNKRFKKSPVKALKVKLRALKDKLKKSKEDSKKPIVPTVGTVTTPQVDDDGNVVIVCGK